MKAELILKRKDGSQILIEASVWLDTFKMNYRVIVAKKEKGKRTWRYISNADDYSYRRLSPQAREDYALELI